MAGGRDRRSTVLHYVQTWLPLSEQFVHTLVTHTEHPAVVVARAPLENAATFPVDRVTSLARLLPAMGKPTTARERRTITAALMAIGVARGVRLVHHHHGYRMRDVEGFVMRRDVPWVVSLHGHDVTGFRRDYPWYYDDAFREVDAVIVPSQWLTPHVTDLGVAEERVHVIPSGVDTTFFTPTPVPLDSHEVLFVGRFVEKKGIDVLLDAWRTVRAAVPDATLRLLGFGPLEPLARSGGEGTVVEVAAPERRAEQLREAIHRARVIVTPSRTAADGDVETLLLVNLEAQACGRPVVTTRHGGIPEYVDEGGTALVVPENDAGVLADALITVLRDDDLASRLGRAGPRWVEPFSVSRSCARVDALYDALLDGT